MSLQRLKPVLPPLVALLLLLIAWEGVVRFYEIPTYILPSPLVVAAEFIRDGAGLWRSYLFTLKTTFIAMGAATLVGVVGAVAFTESALLSASLFPYAVILQVTPIVAIAPLILIYIPDPFEAVLLCATLVAFFPVLANTTVGLRSVDPGHLKLFRLYGASRLQILLHLRFPGALPYFLSGLKIAGGLSLVGAVVAEFAAGSAGTETGLAYRILESGYRLNIPGMFACLFMLSLTGILIFGALTLIQHLLLRRWHD